jgi:hypothetical protein
MFKRPAIRPRATTVTPSTRPTEGSFLHSILYPPKCEPYKRETTYIQNYDNYIDNLRKSCEMSGAEFVMPKYVLPLPEKERVVKKTVPRVEYLDHVIMRVNVLKCGKVRVKLLPHMAMLHEKYFSKNKIPPAKTLAATLKAIGYDEEFTSNVPKKIEQRKADMETRYKKLELVFNKPTTSSKKKKKEPEPEREEDIEEEEEENEDDDAAPDEEALGVDDEDDDEAVVEEEYISDVE